jgi:hypothetical protein
LEKVQHPDLHVKFSKLEMQYLAEVGREVAEFDTLAAAGPFQDAVKQLFEAQCQKECLFWGVWDA